MSNNSNNNLPNLPWGYTNQQLDDWQQQAIINQNNGERRINWGANCTCGCWVTYGKDCPIEFHSPWCDLIRKETTNET